MRRFNIPPEVAISSIIFGSFATITGLFIYHELKAGKILHEYKMSILNNRNMISEIDEVTMNNPNLSAEDRAFTKNYLEGLYRRMINANTMSDFDEWIQKLELYIFQLKSENAQAYIEYMKLKEANRLTAEERELALKQSETIASAIKTLSRTNTIDINLKQ